MPEFFSSFLYITVLAIHLFGILRITVMCLDGTEPPSCCMEQGSTMKVLISGKKRLV